MIFSLAHIMAVANKRARELGVDISQSLVSAAQNSTDGVETWRITYSPKNYLGRRGGDLMIDIEPNDASITRVLKGQ